MTGPGAGRARSAWSERQAQEVLDEVFLLAGREVQAVGVTAMEHRRGSREPAQTSSGPVVPACAHGRNRTAALWKSPGRGARCAILSVIHENSSHGDERLRA